MDAIFLLGGDRADENRWPQTILVIGPITGGTISTLISYLRRALASAPTGQTLDIQLDLSC